MIIVVISHDNVPVYIRAFDDEEEGKEHGAQLAEYMTADGMLSVASSDDILKILQDAARDGVNKIRKKSSFIV